MNPTALTEMVDRVFGDRYRIEELVGFGAISAVYSAFDSAEDRWVALKVFDESIHDNDGFIERLFMAVEQAAVLGHPNIVEIHDWGIDNGPYIVTELCDGGSLAGLIAAGHRLEASQALVVTLECSRALEYGHEQGAIHRNLTPGNVLFSADGHVRLTDYGLATVLADAPIARAERALEGVRYSSPEQARGRAITEATDMYSLALVMNEATTGVAPTVAETVVGTLMDRAEAPVQIDPALQSALPVLERCGRVEPDQRPEAGELAIALLATAETMARPSPLPLSGPVVDPSAVAASPLLVAGGSDSNQVGVPAPQPEIKLEADPAVDLEVAVPTLSIVQDLDSLEQAEPVFAEVPETEVANDLGLVDATAAIDHLETLDDLDVPDTPTAARSAVAYAETHDDADDRLPWWPLVVLGLLVAAAVAAGAYFTGFAAGDSNVQVPDLTGAQYDEVVQGLQDRGWEVERLENRLDGAAEGSIIAQNPAAGAELDEGATVSVTVSLGNEMVEIPSDIAGLTIEQTESRLGTVGLTVGRLARENNEFFAEGLVIGLNEPTTQMPMGQGVSLRVSLGPEDRIVPSSIVGLPIGDATSLLVGLRLQADEESAFSADIEAGIVIGSIPQPGEAIPADSAVVLIVSAGPEPVTMPDIVGFTLEEAVDEIEALGLIWNGSTEGTPGEDVIGSLPPIGATADIGAEVTIILADPPEDEEDADDE